MAGTSQDRPCARSTLQKNSPSAKSASSPCRAHMQHAISAFFKRLGVLVARYPQRCILLSILGVACMSLGLLFIETVVDYQLAWTPKHSEAWGDKQYFDSTWTTSMLRWCQVILVPGTASGASANALSSSAALLHLFKLHKRILQIPGFEKACYREAGQCRSFSPLSLWGHNKSALGTQDWRQPLALNPLRDNFGNVVPMQAIFGNGARGANGAVVSAQALVAGYALRGDTKVDQQRAKDVEKAFISAIQAFKVEEDAILDSPKFRISFLTASSFEVESTKMMENDTKLIGIAIAFMVLYVSINLGSRPPLHSRILLGCTCVLSVGFALGVGFGICGFIGVPFNQTSQLAIFILMGIGIDDMFVIVHCFDRVDRSLPIEERLGAAFSVAGPSIMLTSLTDFLAFTIGSTIDLPAISQFCLTSALSVLAVFVIQLTFFCGVLVLDEHRVARRKRDCCCCFAAPEDVSVPAWMDRGEKWLHLKIRTVVGPFLMRPSSKAAVIVFFVVLAGVSTLGAVRLKPGLTMRHFVRGTSHVRAFVDARDEFLGGRTMDVSFCVKNFSPGKPRHLTALRRLHNSLISLPPSRGHPTIKNADVDVSSWLVAFEEWRNTTTDVPVDQLGSDSFVSNLREFLATSKGLPYRTDVVWSSTAANNTAAIRACRLRARLHLPPTKDREIELDRMRAARMAARVPKDVLDCIAYNDAFTYLDRYAVIGQLAIQNLALASAAVFIALLLFQHARSAVLVLLCIIMVDVDILGLMYLWNVQINVASVCNLVMAIGFAVDYGVHIAEAFAVSNLEDKNSRTIHALSDLGSSVLHGGASTFLAILFLAFSESGGFRILFKMFFGLVGFGLLHGLILLPVLLSIAGPPPASTAATKSFGSRSRVVANAEESQQGLDISAPDASCIVVQQAPAVST